MYRNTRNNILVDTNYHSGGLIESSLDLLPLDRYKRTKADKKSATTAITNLIQPPLIKLLGSSPNNPRIKSATQATTVMTKDPLMAVVMMLVSSCRDFDFSCVDPALTLK